MGKKALSKNADIPIRTIVDWYDAWLRDESPGKVAAVMEVTLETVRRWTNNVPDMAMVKALAESRRGNRNSFSGYVFNRLSPEAQETWDRIRFWDDGEGAYEKVNEILSGKPTRLVQELFVHAMVSCSFDLSSAMRMVCVTKMQVDSWRANDLGFRQLIEEIKWHQKNFFEKALVGLIEQQHPAAVIFANKTINADRGYNEKIQVEHSGTVTATQFSLDDLELDIDTRKKILVAMRQRELRMAPTPAPVSHQVEDADPIDV